MNTGNIFAVNEAPKNASVKYVDTEDKIRTYRK